MSNLEPKPTNHGYVYRTTRGRMPSVASTSAGDEGDISLRFLVGVWSQWWKWLIPVSILLIGGSAAGVLWLFTPQFRASARIEIAERAPWIVSQDQGPKAMQFVETQIEMLRSARVLNAVLEDPEIAEMPEVSKRLKPIEWLSEEGLEISPVGRSTFVQVAFEGRNPESAAKLVNRVIRSYFTIQSEQKDLRTAKVLEALRANKKTQSATVSRLQKLVKSLSKNLEVVPDFTNQIVVRGDFVSPTQDLMDRISEADFEVADLEAAVAAIQSSLETSNYQLSPALVQSRLDSLPDVLAIRKEIQTLNVRLGQIEAAHVKGKDSTSYMNTQNRIDALMQELTTVRNNSIVAIQEEVRAMDRMQIEKELALTQTDLEQKRSVVATLKKRYDEKREKIQEEGNTRLEFQFAVEELQRALGLFAKISERESQMTAELGAPGRPAVFRWAEPPKEPVRKLPLTELGATTLASLLLPMGFAFLWESTVRRINSVEQLESKTQTEVIGEISRLPARRARHRNTMGQELGLFEESIDSLRTSLLLSNEDQDMQVLSVCSAVSGEGKTSVSSQLAVSIARATGQPVLLIDGDMRAPDIHEIFEIPLSPGLSDVLDRRTSLEESINRSWSEHVHLLPAGILDKSPHKLLGTPDYRTLLDEARLWYRYIVVDTPPVLAASESLVIAKHADGTIVCAMRDFSRENHVRLAHARLQSTGAIVIGTVLNGVPVRSYASRYGSYGRYGYAKP